MDQESDDQAVALADALDALFGGVGDLGQGGGGPIGQLQVLEVGPEVLDRVELRRVGGEPLDGQPVVLAVEEGRILVLQWASDIALAFLTDYPTPQAAARLGQARLAAFCRRHAYRGGKPPAELLGRLRDSTPSRQPGWRQRCWPS